MALFTAIATAIGTAIGLTGVALTIFTAVGATVLSIGVSTLVARSMVPKGSSGTAGGGRVQLPPATDNKIPVVYGSAFLGGPITDAKISVNQKFMWYVVALAEHTDSTAGSGYTFDTSRTYYDGKKVQFGSNGVVTGLINNTTPAELDTKMNGKIYIWLFPNGSSSGINTGGQTAIQILSDASTGGGIPVGQRWTSTDTMSNCAFAIVRVEYNEKADTTSLGALMCNLSNSITKPGEALLDYMLNTRYGCAIPLSRIDTVSLTALDAYSDEIITYTGGTQERYRINGPVNTSNNCLDNLQILVDSCDSWLQYSELSAKWKVVINQSYTDYTTINNLFLIDSSNLVGGINVAPINLNETYNELEVAYPNKYIKDQTDYQIIQLEDYQPGVMSPNEAVNKLNLDYPIINNAVQAKYLGIRRLLQSREDLTITFKTDYSGIQIEAGDVIRVKQEVYGWDVLNSGAGKLFRVASVAEEKYSDGSLGVSIGAFEYNDTIYADQAITDFQPDPNLGISDPNIIDIPNAPTVELLLANTIGTMEVTGTVPNVGLITNLNFNFGNDSNVSNHRYYTTVSNANGIPLVNNANFTIEASDLPANTYYWSVLARNQTSGVTSNASNSVSWGGQNVTTSNTFTACNSSSSGTLITSDAIANLAIGGLVTITTGTGTLQANTRVANVVSNTQFNVNLIPTVALSNACIKITSGGIQGNNIQANTVTSNNMTVTGVTAGSYTNTNLTVDAQGRITAAANGTGGGGGGNISILDEGNLITNAVSSINFTGTGVVASSGGGNSVVVTINTGSGTGAYAYVNDNSFALNGGVNPATAVNLLGSYGACRIPGDQQANTSTGNFEASTANSFYPWFTNSSSTTDGYLANSTAICTPDNAGLQDLGTPVALGGRQGWWTVIGTGIPVGDRAANAQFHSYNQVQMQVRDGNAAIQTAGWYKIQEIANTSNISNVIRMDSTIDTFSQTVDRPSMLTCEFDVEGNATFQIYEVGMAVRVTSSGSNGIVIQGTSLTTKPNSWDFNNLYWIRP